MKITVVGALLIVAVATAGVLLILALSAPKATPNVDAQTGVSQPNQHSHSEPGA